MDIYCIEGILGYLKLMLAYELRVGLAKACRRFMEVWELA